MLKIENLQVKVDNKIVLDDFCLNVKEGEIHAIVGPNGAGKSSLASTLIGDPNYLIEQGSIEFCLSNFLNKTVEERSKDGFFVAFQNPIEIPTITLLKFLKEAYNLKLKALDKLPISEEKFSKILEEKLALLGLSPDFKKRGLNEGFSGGEKKRSELLQMLLLEPKCAFLDEIDSGLDTDAQKLVAKTILQSNCKTVIFVSHSISFLRLINPQYVHILVGGMIVKTGGVELIDVLEREGYASWQNT